MYDLKDAALAPVRKQLPVNAMPTFLGAANAKVELGADHNECMRAGWAAVKGAGWVRGEKGRWTKGEEFKHCNECTGSMAPKCKADGKCMDKEYMKFDPSQRRDDHGRWSSDGGGGLGSLGFREVGGGQELHTNNDFTTYRSAAGDLQWNSDGSWELRRKDGNRQMGRGIEALRNLIGKVILIKVDEEQHMVYAWASVIVEKGVPVEDMQGDVIERHELEKATTDFMEHYRYAAEMHQRGEDQRFRPEMSVGMVVHSFPMTKDIMEALGVQSEQEGWVVGIKVRDDGVWSRIKSGELGALSIGGSGRRDPVEA